MRLIIVEAVLFLALLVVVVLIVRTIVRDHTPVGTRLEQAANRRAIDRAASLTCDRHGRHDERDMVRLRSGELLCPQCYREIVASIV
jgi:hypothetical protein